MSVAYRKCSASWIDRMSMVNDMAMDFGTCFLPLPLPTAYCLDMSPLEVLQLVGYSIGALLTAVDGNSTRFPSPPSESN